MQLFFWRFRSGTASSTDAMDASMCPTVLKFPIYRKATQKHTAQYGTNWPRLTRVECAAVCGNVPSRRQRWRSRWVYFNSTRQIDAIEAGKVRNTQAEGEIPGFNQLQNELKKTKIRKVDALSAFSCHTTSLQPLYSLNFWKMDVVFFF